MDLQHALYWSEGVCNDPCLFHAEAGRCVSVIEDRRRRKDAEGAEFWLERLKAGRRFAEIEPFASAYDHAMSAAWACLADWAVCEYRFDTALRLAGLAWELLDSKDRRRAKAKLAPKPSSEVRVALIATLADAKWHGPESLCDAVLTSDQLVAQWRAAGARVAAWLDSSGAAGPAARRCGVSLLWAGVWVIACARRYCPRRVMAMTAEFNRWHQRLYGCASLALADWHFRENLPLNAEKPWYWLNEINKLWELERRVIGRRSATAVFDEAELDGLYTSLLASVQAELPRDQLLYEAFTRDWQWMRGALRRGARERKLEVMSFA